MYSVRGFGHKSRKKKENKKKEATVDRIAKAIEF